MEDRRRAAVRHRSRRGTHRARAPGDDSHHGVEHVMSVDEAQNWRRHVGGRAGELLGVARVNGSAERIREPCKAWSKILRLFRNRCSSDRILHECTCEGRSVYGYLEGLTLTARPCRKRLSIFLPFWNNRPA